MNLRNAGKFNIGLDIGTSSVGWAVTDSEGDLFHFKGKPTWGSRLFAEADKASEARTHRSQRRRYDRRRQRLDILQMLFAEEMSKVDPEFFIRLRQSRLLPDDRTAGHEDYLWPLFNNADLSEPEYYRRFPTIYHLRKWLVYADEKADIRLIYLAFHNIVKHRGNFLQQDNKSLTAENASVADSVDMLCEVLTDWCALHDIDCTACDNKDEIAKELQHIDKGKTALKESIAPLLGIQQGPSLDKRSADNMARELSASMIGASTKIDRIFFLFSEKPEGAASSIYLSNDEQVEAFEEICPDDGLELFEALKAVYSAFILQEILSMAPGETLSANKVEEYGRYRKDLKLLKNLFREYAPSEYHSFFRGPLFQKLYENEKPKYDITKARGYTRYNLVRSMPYDDFRKEVEKAFKGTKAEGDPRYMSMMEAFASQSFLRRLKTSDNGAIPYQLHLEEMDKIIENQSRYYPFLEAEKDKLDSLVSFRIPYYVGPLTQKNARRANDKEDGELRFAWSERLPGKENERVYPWNWEEVIDKDSSAENFIMRMTGTCTYLYGEPVLPRSSLLYEEFCVLNELNGAHFSLDGDREYRFDYRDRSEMIDQLFRNGGVSYEKIANWMERRGRGKVHVGGAQGEKGFESRLSSYIFFKKDIFGVDEIPISDYPMIESIILWNTIFEDRDILKRKLKKEYGDRLSDDQIKKICRKRFSGWGRLSKKLLTGVKVESDNGPVSIMDVLREGNPNNGCGAQAMVLMEVLRDDKLRFQEAIDGINAERLSKESHIALDDLPGSPALRRGINQALGIVEEIVRIAGHAPENIFVEVTRFEGKKGERTKHRYDALKERMSRLKSENPEFWDADVQKCLNEHAGRKVDLTERLALYFMQGGKSLYSGKPLDISRLSEKGVYEVDHILPQSYIKDDSMENKALVLKEENQRKSDQMLLPREMRVKMKPFWRALLEARMIGEKKYRNLLREEIKDNQLKGFINRQIVETGQIAKIVQLMLGERYPETAVLPVKAGLSAELRLAAGFPKCREVNDFHHAHDAFLASEIGRFIKLRFPKMYGNPLAYQRFIRAFVKDESQNVRRGKRPYGSSFIISSFMRSGFDKETGEVVEDSWDACGELASIRRSLDERRCFISHMPKEDTGEFWDSTIYSPHDPKKKDQLKLPLKKGLDPKRYGSYSRERFAYFFIYEIASKSKHSLELAPVPISVASTIASDEKALAKYAEKLSEDAGAEFVRIVRRKVFKYQLMEIDGSLLYVTGKKEVRNGVQIAVDLHEADIAARIVSEKVADSVVEVSEAEVIELFDRARRSILTYSPRLANAIKLGEWDDEFMKAPVEEKKHVVMELFAIASAKKNMIDLRAVGLGKNVGCMKITYPKVLGGHGADIIDQSITGMFERRTHIGL